MASAFDRIEQRLGRERGTLGVGRPAAVAMAYPSPYRVGMASLGFQTLYRELNELGIGAHRVFLPDEWEPASLPWPQPKQAIVSYEARRPLSDYPIIGLSIAYELEVAGVIRLLDGAGIPVLARDRGRRDPIVIGGGPITTSNPSVVLPFVDVLIAGEAEALLPEAVARIEAADSRDTALAAVASLPHTTVGEIGPGVAPTIPAPARAPSDRLPARSAIVTPDSELSDMFLIEPERGCSRQCTFCVMRGPATGGMRVFDPGRPLELVPEHARRVGLVGAAVTDHPQLESLVASIVDSGRGVGVSSLRADRLTPGFLATLARGGYRSITVASDGISQRMRDGLRRKISEEDLLRAATLVAEHGFHRLKVYEMIGVPGEDDRDVEELIRFAGALADRVRLTLTFSTFVAKRNTPLDGQPFVGVKQAEDRLRAIRAGLRGRVEIRPQPPKWAWVEYMLAQRGVEGGHAALAAVRAGGRFSDYRRALSELGPNERPLVFGDEAAWARRKGKAATRPKGRLPIA